MDVLKLIHYLLLVAGAVVGVFFVVRLQYSWGLGPQGRADEFFGAITGVVVASAGIWVGIYRCRGLSALLPSLLGVLVALGLLALCRHVSSRYGPWYGMPGIYVIAALAVVLLWYDRRRRSDTRPSSASAARNKANGADETARRP